MSGGHRDVSYFCVACASNRKVSVNTQNHVQKLKNSPNGLVEYSDPHACYDGFLSIYRLYVDHDYNVRSFSLVELPSKKLSESKIPGIPMPKASAHNVYNIDEMLPDGEGYRLTIFDKQVNVFIRIGNIGKEEEPLGEILSEQENVKLEYYKSDHKIRLYDRKWFQELVDALEDLPPTKLGLFIETLRFVYANNDVMPYDFSITQLKTILAAHKTKFKINKEGRVQYRKIKNVTDKYGKDKRTLIDQIIQLVENKPMITLEELVQETEEDLVHLIYMLLIMSNEFLLDVERDIN